MGKRVTRALAATVMGLLVAACGGDPEGVAPTPAETEVTPPPAKAQAATNAPVRRPASVRYDPEARTNSPPIISALSLVDETGEDGAAYWRAVVEARDPDGDSLALHYVWYVNGTESDVKGEIFDPSGHRRGDRIQLEVWANDGRADGPSAKTGIVEISNAPPEIVSEPPARLQGGSYLYDVVAKDPEGDAPLLYELASKPKGMRIDAYTGKLSWRPSSHQMGIHTIVITVSDPNGGRSTQSFQLPIVDPNAVPAALGN